MTLKKELVNAVSNTSDSYELSQMDSKDAEHETKDGGGANKDGKHFTLMLGKSKSGAGAPDTTAQ